jgi:hypothetical protein
VVSRRRREEEEERDEDGRRAPRKATGMSPATIAMLGIAAAGVFVVLMIAMGAGGVSHNVKVRQYATKMVQEGGRHADAVAYIEQNGRPDEKDYAGLAEDLAGYRRIVAGQAAQVRQQEARDWLEKNVMRRTVTPGFAPKDRLPDREIAERLRQFLTQYGDTFSAKELLNSRDPNMEALRQLLRENIDPKATAAAALQQGMDQAETFMSQNQWGSAVGTLEGMRNYQRLFLSSEQYQELMKILEPKLVEVKARARAAFDSALAGARGAAAAGRMKEARARIEALKTSFPIPELIQAADLALEQLR